MQDQSLAVLIGLTRFDQVFEKNKDGSFSQAYPDLPAAKKDCDDLQECLQKYRIQGEDDIYRLDDPIFKLINKNFSKIRTRIKKNPDRNFLTIWLFAGHGILKLGMQ